MNHKVAISKEWVGAKFQNSKLGKEGGGDLGRSAVL